jgi:hypothetical protein
VMLQLFATRTMSDMWVVFSSMSPSKYSSESKLGWFVRSKMRKTPSHALKYSAVML